METNDMKKIENIRIRPLSNEERSRAWNGIASRLPSTPVLSPFVFPLHKTLSFAAIFIFLIGTVSASDSARPGQLLFPIDIAVERIESSIDSSSQVDHAQERLIEFDAIVGSDVIQETPQETPTAARMEKAAAPIAPINPQPSDVFLEGEPASGAADMMMMSSTVSDGPAPTPLSDEIEQAIATTRAELEEILNKALMDDDTETVVEIMATIDEFEAKVNTLRGSSF